MILLLAIFVIGAAGLIGYAQWKLSRLVLGGIGEIFPTRVYSAPYVIHDQVWISPDRLIRRLDRLGYRRLDHQTPGAPGDYAWEAPRLRVFLRPIRLPAITQDAEMITLTLTGMNQWTLFATDGTARPYAALEPELIADLSGPKKVRREPAIWPEIPTPLVRAVMAVEDRRFLTHIGLDPRAIGRAIWHNLRRKTGLEGGSTITQQLAKNLLLTPQRSVRRKLAEAVCSLYLEWRYTKPEIMTLYLNHIYLGQDGPLSIAGVTAAAQHYFGKPLKTLSIGECAFLAGIIQRPSRYNPWRHSDAALDRRNLVLRRMHRESYLTDEELEGALIEPLIIRPLADDSIQDDAAYVVAEAVRQLTPRFSEEELYRYGLAIHTTMDPLIQNDARQAAHLTRRQSAIVVLDPSTGRILSIMGGRDFRQSQFNRATQASRQPGSAFKPFVYAAALERGWTPASTLFDETHIYRRTANTDWRPRNYDDVYHGTVPLRRAMALSLNAATIDLARQVGIQSVIDSARRMGIESPLDHSLALALGTSEVTLLELAAAYAPFSNGGFAVKPFLVTTVHDAHGNIIESFGPVRSSVLHPAIARLMTSLLESVVQEGTARSLPAAGWKRPTAGKTGTTNAGRDAWFVGYTPEVLAGVWVGDDRNQAMNLAGAKDALPVWHDLMKRTLADLPESRFRAAEGIIEAVIDPQTGLRAVAGCPEKRQELFLAGTEPTQSCARHRRGVAGWLDRLLGRD